MSDHMAIVQERIKKAEAKVQRYRKSLESAESELSDLTTALRVLEGITNGGDSNASGTATTIGRQIDIVGLLGVGLENASQPADLFPIYKGKSAEDISIDTFRTTIWRMKDKVFETDGREWVIHGDSGKYWKEPLRAPEPDPPEPEYEASSDESPWDQGYEPSWDPPEEEPYY